jgi:MSHA biogenesis protein MshQ
VTARNAGNTTTLNFDGSGSVTPSFAQAVTLADAGPLNLGTLAGASIAANAFAAGVADATPSYAFTSKTTAPQTLVLRASNGGSGGAAISSLGYSEASMPLRSGRLRLSNAFGSAAAALKLAVVAEYWSANAWVLNSADSCTTLAAGSVALSNPRNAAGNASSALTSASAIGLSSGSGLLTLAKPTPVGSSLSLDLAINLGSSTADQSCQASHPASTGAAQPWLRAQNGGCAATADRDPAARASFGVFSPETRKTVHVREIF